MGEHLEQLQQGGEDKRKEKEGESTGAACSFFPPPSPRRQEENANSVLPLLFLPYAFLPACCLTAALALPFFLSLCSLSFSFISLLPSPDPTTAEMHSNRVAAEADATTIPPPFLLFHPPPPSLFPSLLLGNIYQCFAGSQQKV